MRSKPPARSTWGDFKAQPERGMANFASEVSTLRAAGLVATGEVFNLDYPLGAFTPSLSGRPGPRQTITQGHPNQLDDYWDGFYPQCSSHIDGLRHRRHEEHGFYGGVADKEIGVGLPALGVHVWAENPIVGRGVLVDIAEHRRSENMSFDHFVGEAFSVREIDSALGAQDVELGEGDILLLHTGWAHWFLKELGDDSRRSIVKHRRATGLEGTAETIEWFLDKKVSLAASDTYSLEVYPPRTPSALGLPHEEGFIHQELIALLGLPIGEQWLLHDLAEFAATHRRYEFMTVCKPLNLTGGVGSPANALAIA